MKTVILSVAGAIVITATALAWQASRDTADTLAARERVARDVQRADAASQTAAQRSDQAEAAAADLRAQVDELRHRTAVQAAAEVEARIAQARAAAKSTRVQLADAAAERVWFENLYRPFFAQHGWPAGRAAEFITIGMKRYERLADVRALKNDKILSGSDSAVAKYEANTRAEEDAAYRALLSPEEYQQWADYSRTSTARQIFSALAAAAVVADIPFTRAQLDQFIEIAAANYLRPHADPSADSSVVHASFDPIDWDRTDAQLRPLMSESQWRLYLTHAPGFARDRSRMQNKFDQLMEIARAADEAAAESATPK